MNKRSESAKEGYSRTVRAGKVFSAPLGYRHALVGGKKMVVFDDKADMVKEAFVLYSTNEYSIKFLSEILQVKYSHPISRSTLHRALRNPFYYGYMVYEEKLYPHKCEKLISKGLFDKVQKLITKNCYTKRVKGSYHTRLYRKLLYCKECGCVLTPEKHKGKYVYYKCTGGNGKHPFKAIREEVINERIKPVLDMYGIEDKIYENPTKMRIFFKLAFLDIWGNSDGTVGLTLRNLTETENLASYINYDAPITNLPKEAKSLIVKEITNSDHPLLKFCITPRSIDDICDTLNLDLMDAQMQLMDLQLNDFIKEENGLWKTV